MSFRDALLLRAAAIWTVIVWATFVRNIVTDNDHSTGFKAVHVLLAIVSVIFALAIWAVATPGCLPPLGAAAIIGVMLNAILSVHAPKGLWVQNGGFEYPLVMIAVAFAIAGAGPGALSVGGAFGRDFAGTGWAVAALGL